VKPLTPGRSSGRMVRVDPGDVLQVRHTLDVEVGVAVVPGEHLVQRVGSGDGSQDHYELSSAFRRAVHWRRIDRSPISDVAVPSAPHPEPQTPTPAEAARLLLMMLVTGP
jgi:integrase